MISRLGSKIWCQLVVPAIKFKDTGEVVWESYDIMMRLEADFPQTPLTVAEADALIDGCSRLLQAGARLVFGGLNVSSPDDAKQLAVNALCLELDALDEAIGASGGPFLAGANFSVVDLMYLPFLERWEAQLPITAGINLRAESGQHVRWPNLELWFDAILQHVEPYRERVRGDRYSWLALVGSLQRARRSSISEPQALTAVDNTIRKADRAATYALRDAGSQSQVPKAARLEAARVLLAKHEDVVADATSKAVRSQPQLVRQEEDDSHYVDEVLREAMIRLLASTDHNVQGESIVDALDSADPLRAMAWAQAAKFVAARICVPRDMGAPAAAALRSVLLQICADAELLAWKSSGGLL